ncbi:MAG: hypothetical protein Q9218_003681 [Villophora microphyllina]
MERRGREGDPNREREHAIYLASYLGNGKFFLSCIDPDCLTTSRSKYEKHLNEALKLVYASVGELQAQNKVLYETSAKRANLQSKKRDLALGTPQSYTVSEYYNRLRTDNMQDIRSSALTTLWKYFPPRRASLDGKVGNRDNPGDGVLYKEQHIEEARSALRALHQALSNPQDSSMCPLPPQLPEMAAICLILTNMRCQNLLEDFLDSNKLDSDLPLNKEQIAQVLRHEHSEHASTFFTEQSRVKPRTWNEGQHLELEEEEPLPFKFEQDYDEGSYGKVSMVSDPRTGEFFARKQQHTSNEEHEYIAAQNHLKEEREHLKDLRHRHVVQFVKSYQRGRAYGIILKPAATTNLERLIPRYYDDRYDSNHFCKTRQWLRPIFLHTFGCLSIGLAYIHSRNIRHKDVKPANILYEKAIGHNGPRLLWADFGLAYDFTATGNSKTKSTKVYSQRYAAPEIVAANTRHILDQNAITERDFGPNNEDESVVPDAQIASDFKETDETEHGRKTDVFSLGCVFLEMLACLLDERLPMDSKHSKRYQSPPKATKHLPPQVRMFSQHIPELIEWAQKHIESGRHGDLTPLLEVTVTMISPVPDDRPTIDHVVNDVADAGLQHFCDECSTKVRDCQSTGAPNGHVEPVALTGPSSPQITPRANRPTASFTPRTVSVNNLFARVNSGGLRIGSRPQVKRIFETLP